MAELFENKANSNPDISKRNTSSVTSFVSPQYIKVILWASWAEKNTSLTLLLFLSTTTQYHHYSPRHDDLEQYGTTTSSTLLLQRAMFRGATSFNQDVSGWDTSSATGFVSGLGPWDSAACWCRLRRRVFRLLEHCRCCSWAISWLLAAWLLCCSRRMQYYCCHAHEEQHQHERKQTNNLTIKHKSHTTIILFNFTISSLFSSWLSRTIRDHYFYTLFTG